MGIFPIPMGKITLRMSRNEKTGKLKGVYHVLHGAIDPLSGIGPDELMIENLVERVKKNNIEEINKLINDNIGTGWEKFNNRLGENKQKVGRKQINSWEKTRRKLGENQLKIVALILLDKNITSKKISEILGIIFYPLIKKLEYLILKEQ